MFHEFKENLFVNVLTINSNNELYAASKKNIYKLNAVSGDIISVFEGHSDLVYSLVLSSDGTWLYSGSEDKTIRKWNTTTGHVESVYEGYKRCLTSLMLSPNDDWLYFTSRLGTIYKLNTTTGLVEFEFKQKATSFTLSYDGLWLYARSAECQILKICADKDDLSICLVKPKTVGCHDYCMRPTLINQNWLYYASNDGNNGNGTIYKWNTNTGELVRTFEGHNRYIYYTTISCDGEWLYSGGWDGTVREWNATSGECTRKFCFSIPISTIVLSSNEERLFVGLRANTPIVRIELKYDEKVSLLVYNWLDQNDTNRMCDCNAMRDMICSYLSVKEKVFRKRKL